MRVQARCAPETLGIIPSLRGLYTGLLGGDNTPSPASRASAKAAAGCSRSIAWGLPLTFNRVEPDRGFRGAHAVRLSSPATALHGAPYSSHCRLTERATPCVSLSTTYWCVWRLVTTLVISGHDPWAAIIAWWNDPFPASCSLIACPRPSGMHTFLPSQRG
jgi:hypothetical protein